MGIFKALFKDNNEFNVKQLKTEVDQLSQKLRSLESGLERTDKSVFGLLNPFKFNIGDAVSIENEYGTAFCVKPVKFTVLTRKVFTVEKHDTHSARYSRHISNTYDLHCEEPEGRGTIKNNICEYNISKYEEPTTETK